MVLFLIICTCPSESLQPRLLMAPSASVAPPRGSQPMRNWLHISHSEERKKKPRQDRDEKKTCFFFIPFSGSRWSDIDCLTLAKYSTLHGYGCWWGAEGRPRGTQAELVRPVTHRGGGIDPNAFFCECHETDALIFTWRPVWEVHPPLRDAHLWIEHLSGWKMWVVYAKETRERLIETSGRMDQHGGVKFTFKANKSAKKPNCSLISWIIMTAIVYLSLVCLWSVPPPPLHSPKSKI